MHAPSFRVARTRAREKTVEDQPVTREISAGFVVFRRTPEGPKFLILYHGHRYWNFPKGKIESEERSLDAAFRETREETGLSERDVRAVSPFKAHERFTFRRGGERIFKIVIFYLGETRKRDIRLSEEHQGYGWFSYREGVMMLGRYRDSLRVLKQAYDFLRKQSARRAPQNPPRQGGNVR